MTTDKIEIKEDTGEDTNDKHQPQATLEGGHPAPGAQQPPQPQHRTDSQTAVPARATKGDVGLPVGNKGESPGNGG